jgi:hypothetical protein
MDRGSSNDLLWLGARVLWMMVISVFCFLSHLSRYWWVGVSERARVAWKIRRGARAASTEGQPKPGLGSCAGVVYTYEVWTIA